MWFCLVWLLDDVLFEYMWSINIAQLCEILVRNVIGVRN